MAAESNYFYIFLLEFMSLFYEELINNSKITMNFSLNKSIFSFLLERIDNLLSKLQEIKSISLKDDINKNFKKYFENKNDYDEIKNIDIYTIK